MKQKKYICYVALGTLLLMAAAAYEDRQNILLTEDSKVSRSEPGEGDLETVLNLTIPELDDSCTYPLLIEEREYTKAEREALFERAKQEIDENFSESGEEKSHITKDVNLAETLQSGIVSVSWSFENGTLIQPDGTIEASAVSEAGAMEIVRAELSYKEYTCIYEFPVYIFRKELSGREKILQEIADNIETEKQTTTAANQLQLPQKVGDYAIQWSEQRAHTPLLILVLGICSMSAIIIGARQQEQKRQEKRSRELQMEYPKMIAKLSLLIGAGMTIKTAWERQVETYVQQRTQGKQKQSELYEQMQITWRQMQEGIGEKSAYEQFGERCGLSLYRRFSLMLIQNLQKGTAGLVQALETEADRAFEERKNMARRLGEEAGTKLLLPMMIMLFVVIIILVVPAFLTMTI